MEPPNACPTCERTVDLEDNYCRECGAPLAIQQVYPAPDETREAHAISRTATSRGLDRRRSSVPAPVTKAVAAVAIGTALQVGASLAGKYLMRRAAGAALDSVKPSSKPSAPKRALKKGEEAAEDGVTVTETFVVQRIWFRRD